MERGTRHCHARTSPPAARPTDGSRSVCCCCCAVLCSSTTTTASRSRGSWRSESCCCCGCPCCLSPCNTRSTALAADGPCIQCGFRHRRWQRRATDRTDGGRLLSPRIPLLACDLPLCVCGWAVLSAAVAAVQCVCVVLLVLHTDEGGVAVCGLMLAVSGLGYLATQLRHHSLTEIVSTAAHRPTHCCSPTSATGTHLSTAWLACCLL